MKKVDLTQKILKKVVSFEKRRIWYWVVQKVILFILFVVLSSFFFWIILIVLKQTQTLGLLGILWEDREVIQLHGREVAETILNEVPIEFFVAILVSVALAIFVIITVVKDLGKISKRLGSIKRYLKNEKRQ